jgi:aspartokinase/homoserine dehydrogenase 1
MKNEMEVLKFGGSSLVSADAMQRARDVLVARRGTQRIVVCSAMGGVTNALIQIGLKAAQGDAGYSTLLDELIERHRMTLDDLGMAADASVRNELNGKFDRLRSLCAGICLLEELSAKSMDQLVSFGERLAVPMVHAWLDEAGLNARRVDARDWIATDDQFGAAEVNREASSRNIREGVQADASFEVLITEGFIGRTADGETTTLGRGGSDYTASLIASAIEADCLEKSTDVPGILTADPRMVPEAQVIAEMSYEEAMELCHFGAKVIYHPTIAPLRVKGIPLIVRSTFNSEASGTRIVASPAEAVTVRGLSSVDGIALMTLEGGSLIGRPGFSSRIFSALAQAGVNVTLITQSSSENSLTVGIAASDLDAGVAALQQDLASDITLNRIAPIRVDEALSIVALVGSGMKRAVGVSGRAFKALADAEVNIRAIAQGSTERNISIVVDTRDVPEALRALHRSFFDQPVDRCIQVFCAGVGQVGREFLVQWMKTKSTFEAELGGEIKLVGLANSTSYVMDANGLEPDANALQDSGRALSASDATEVLRAFHALPGRRKIWVDNSAADAVAGAGIEALKLGMGYVCSNKIAATRSLADWNVLQASSARFKNETNVGAALPILHGLRSMLETGDRIKRIEAVLSGSINYIFSSMDGRQNFSNAVRSAGQKGYTEPDVRIDLSGMDVARKILILARMCGAEVTMEDVQVKGFLPEAAFAGNLNGFVAQLDTLGTAMDAEAAEARASGKRLRFVASYSPETGCACELMALEPSHPFYALEGTDNAVSIHSERYTDKPLVIQGAGAGGALTASGVLSDVYAVARWMFTQNGSSS